MNGLVYVQVMGLWLPIDPHQVIGMKIYTYKDIKLDDPMNFENTEENSISSYSYAMRVGHE